MRFVSDTCECFVVPPAEGVCTAASGHFESRGVRADMKHLKDPIWGKSDPCEVPEGFTCILKYATLICEGVVNVI